MRKSSGKSKFSRRSRILEQPQPLLRSAGIDCGECQKEAKCSMRPYREYALTTCACYPDRSRSNVTSSPISCCVAGGLGTGVGGGSAS